MNDQDIPNPLEAELRQFHPRELSPNFSARLAESLSQSLHPIPDARSPIPTSDRCLLTAISLGALAACVIITLSVPDFFSPSPRPPSSSVLASPSPTEPPFLEEYRQRLARFEMESDSHSFSR